MPMLGEFARVDFRIPSREIFSDHDVSSLCYRGDLPARLFIPGALRISRGSVQVFMAFSYPCRAMRGGCEAHLLICRPRKILTPLTSGSRGALDDHSATLPGLSGRTELAPKPSPILGLTARTNLLIVPAREFVPPKPKQRDDRPPARFIPSDARLR